MAINNEYYSIFPSDLKVIKLSLYNNVAVPLSDKDMLVWFPYGVGFDKFISEGYQVANEVVKYYSCLYKLTDVDQKITLIPTNTCSIPGKYRIIGASLKLTNVTNVTNKGGNVFINRLDDDNASPIYFGDSAKTTPFALTTATDWEKTLKELLDTPGVNSSIKQNVSGTSTVVINEVNNKKGNDIFSSFNEYNSTAYKTGSSAKFLDVSYDRGLGHNIKYKMQATNLTTQRYLVEMWQILEVAPLQGSTSASLGQDSLKGCSQSIMRIINKSNPFKIFN